MNCIVRCISQSKKVHVRCHRCSSCTASHRLRREERARSWMVSTWPSNWGKKTPRPSGSSPPPLWTSPTPGRTTVTSCCSPRNALSSKRTQAHTYLLPVCVSVSVFRIWKATLPSVAQSDGVEISNIMVFLHWNSSFSCEQRWFGRSSEGHQLQQRHQRLGAGPAPRPGPALLQSSEEIRGYHDPAREHGHLPDGVWWAHNTRQGYSDGILLNHITLS